LRNIIGSPHLCCALELTSRNARIFLRRNPPRLRPNFNGLRCSQKRYIAFRPVLRRSSFILGTFFYNFGWQSKRTQHDCLWGMMLCVFSAGDLFIFKIHKCKMTHRRRLRNVNTLKDSAGFTLRFYLSAPDFFPSLSKEHKFSVSSSSSRPPEQRIEGNRFKRTLARIGWVESGKLPFTGNILWTKKM
jgi:hypothetical protein